MLNNITVRFENIPRLEWITDLNKFVIHKLMHKHKTTDYLTAQTQE